jgi:uracil phosphoribosyltransferase
MVHHLSDRPGLHQTFLAQLRDAEFQKDRFLFRKNMEKLGQILAYEISQTLPTKEMEIRTPLGSAKALVPEVHPALCCILRAGLPFYQGFQDYFPESPAGFIGAYRGQAKGDHSFDIELDYEALPPMVGLPVIVIDPMLASGKSMLKAARLVQQNGSPDSIILASLIASPEGIAFLKKEIPEASIWTVAIDQGLNEHAYILPGLGDAGDLSFGTKAH